MQAGLSEVGHLDFYSRRSTVLFSPSRTDAFAAAFDGVDMVICDSNTAALLPAGVPRLTTPPGEAAKDMTVLTRLLETFVEQELTRDSRIVALGGGAVTDLVAFAASIYLRGISVTLVPTSLLAMVDAAVGGKTGIDFSGYKNMVGTFAPAEQVIVCPALLETLPEWEYRSGLAEVLKAALLDDPALLELLETESGEVLQRREEVLAEVVRRSVAVKLRVVAEDLTERGRRAILNLGHTFGHALESCLGLGSVTHGEAVAWGIVRAGYLAEQLGMSDSAWNQRTRRLIDLYGFDGQELGGSVEEQTLFTAMQQDKKRRRDGLRFVIQTGPFTTETPVAPREAVFAALRARDGG